MTSPPFQIKTRKLVVSAPTPESIGCLAAPTPECKLRGALRNASHSRIENSDSPVLQEEGARTILGEKNEKAAGLLRKASVPLRREFETTTRAGAAAATLGVMSHGTEAPSGRAVRLCFSSGGRAFGTESGFEWINKAPTPVHASIF